MVVAVKHMAPKLLIVGGGFAGTTLAKGCSGFADVTLVDSKTYMEMAWATVRAVVDDAVADKCSFDYKDVPGLGKVVQGTVVELGANSATLETGDILRFDYCAICSGSSYSDSFGKSPAVTRQDRLTQLHALRGRIQAAKSIVVVGGGPAGIEAAAEIVEAYAGKHVTLVHNGKQLLSGAPAKAGALAQKFLESHGVNVVLGTRVTEEPPPPAAGGNHEPSVLSLSSGQKLQADLVLWCVGTKPNTSFIGGELSGTVNAQGFVKVGPTLQVVGQPHIFALGDCNDVPETKLGYLAGEQAKVTAANLAKVIKAGSTSASGLKAYKPYNGSQMMIVSLGRGDGVCIMGTSTVCGGCLPANIKSKNLFVDMYRKNYGVK